MNIYSDAKQVLRRKRTFRIKFYFIIFLFLILLASIFYLLVYSSVLKIKNISVENIKFLTQDEIIRLVKPIVLGGKLGGLAGFENMISWPNGEIIAPHPIISSINIKKNWFRKTIEVRVNERQRFAVWCQQETQNSADKARTNLALRDESTSCWWMDKQGVVFAEAPLAEGSLVFTIFDLRKNNLFLGSKIEEDRFVGNLISILENLSKTGLEAQKIIFDNSLKELRVDTIEGPILLFSVRFDSSKNIPLIANLNPKKMEYIDLRVENKIFYKTLS